MESGWPRTLVRWIESVLLALWVGGITILGAVVAPAAFRDAGIGRQAAGRLVGLCLSRFNLLCLAAGPLLLIAAIVEARRPRVRATIAGWTRPLGFAAMIGITLYFQTIMIPEMERARALGERAAFAAGHAWYETLTFVQLTLGLGVMLLAARAGAAAGTTPKGGRADESIRSDAGDPPPAGYDAHRAETSVVRGASK